MWQRDHFLELSEGDVNVIDVQLPIEVLYIIVVNDL